MRAQREGLNVKVVAAISPQLFASESKGYQESVFSSGEWMDSMVIANRGRRTLTDWIPRRTWGSVEGITEESHLSPKWMLQGIERFVADRQTRLRRLREAVDAADRV